MRERVQRNYANVVSTIALVIALTGTAAFAATTLGRNTVGSKQIRKAAVSTSELHKRSVTPSKIRRNAVRAKQLATASVDSTAIQDGAVSADQLALPAPTLVLSNGEQSANVDDGFERVAALGTIDKQTLDSKLSLDWTGVVSAGPSPCVFQLRVDGQPGATGAGEVFVQNSVTMTASVESLFAAGPGTHQLEVWARTVNSGGASYPCTVDPDGTGVSQTVVLQELVS